MGVIKRYRLTPQEQPHFDVPSALQAVFRRQGFETSQRGIAANLELHEGRYCIGGGRIQRYLERNGYAYQSFCWNTIPLSGEPDHLLGEMREKEGIIKIQGRVFLLEDFADPEMALLDPKTGETTTRDLWEAFKGMQEAHGVLSLEELQRKQKSQAVFGLIKRI